MDETNGWFRIARRWGRPGALTLLGSELVLLRRKVPGASLIVIDHDFDATARAPDSLAARLYTQDTPDSYVRFGITAGVRRLRFTTARGLDRVTGVQNVALGNELLLTVGRTIANWSADPADTYGRLDGFVGTAHGDLTATAAVKAEGRLVDSSPAGVSPWRDLDVTGSAQAYVQPGGSAAHTFVTGLRFSVHGNVDQPYQMAMGGEVGVRSYREDEIPVGSDFVAYAEHRFNTTWFKPTVDFGITVFGDVGRGWASNVPFGIDTGWRKAVGVGLRLGFPAGTGSITRIELAWPIGSVDSGRGPMLRTYWSPTPTSR
jgi:hypothetical protein